MIVKSVMPPGSRSKARFNKKNVKKIHHSGKKTLSRKNVD